MQQVALGATGLAFIASSVVISYLANRLPTYTKALEIIAGTLLLGGFALIGWALPHIERF
jgi:hypothetical protein